MKPVQLVVTVAVVLVLLATVMMPAVSMGIENTSARMTKTNDLDGGIRYRMADTSETITITVADGKMTVGGVEYDLATSVYNIVVTDVMALGISSSKVSMSGPTSKYVSSGTITLDHGTVKVDGTAVSGWGEYTYALVPDVNGDLVKGASGTKYIVRDSVCYGIFIASVLGVTSAKGLFAFDGDGRVTESLAKVQTTEGGPWVDYPGDVGDLLVTFMDLTYDLYGEFTQAPTQNHGASSAQMSSYWIPYRIVYGSEPGLETIISVIPLIVIAALVSIAGGAVLTRGRD